MNIKRPMCILCLVFMLFMYIVMEVRGGVDISEYKSDFASTEIEGRITDKIYKNGKYSLHIKCDRFFIVYLDDQSAFDYRIGQKVRVKGKYQNFSLPENDGQFNMRKYYRIRGYEASINKARVVATGNEYSKIREWLFKIKERTKVIYGYYMGDSEAGTLSAMVLGDKSDLDTDVRDIYQAAGISHILSLSGLHIATVGMCVFSALKLLGIGVVFSSTLSAILMIMYGTMTGLATATVRALIMFLLAICARSIGRTYDLITGVCFATILIIIENPYYVYDSGFLLSVMSVTGIALICPILMEISDNPKSIHKEIFEKVRQSICISISASIATLPIILNTFFKTARYSIFINIIVVPLMSAILGIGIIVLLIGGAIVEFPTIGKAVGIMLYIAEKIIDLYSFLCGNIVKLYGNDWVLGKGEKWQDIVYIILLIIAVTYHQLRNNKFKHLDEERHRLKKRFVITEIGMIVIAVCILTIRTKPQESINALSVGQGACNVIYGENIPTVMIDCGSSDVKDIYRYRVKPFLLSKGIDRIDYLFVTHPDIDHISGVKELLNDDVSEIKVRHLLMSVYDEDLVSMAADKGIEADIISAGDYVRKGGFMIECLNPITKSESSHVKDNVNDESLVLKVIYSGEGAEYIALYTGDISMEKERELLSTSEIRNRLGKVNYMSVPHHGSKYSSCEEFLKKVTPVVCTISAGKDNSYGHPHKETLERFEKYTPSTKVLRTDECGQITVIVEKNKSEIKRYITRY